MHSISFREKMRKDFFLKVSFKSLVYHIDIEQKHNVLQKEEYL